MPSENQCTISCLNPTESQRHTCMSAFCDWLVSYTVCDLPDLKLSVDTKWHNLNDLCMVRWSHKLAHTRQMSAKFAIRSLQSCLCQFAPNDSVTWQLQRILKTFFLAACKGSCIFSRCVYSPNICNWRYICIHFLANTLCGRVINGLQMQ